MARSKDHNKEAAVDGNKAAENTDTTPTLTAEQQQQEAMNKAIAEAIAKHEASKLAMAVIPKQGALFASAPYTAQVKGWQGQVKTRDKRDGDGKAVIGADGKVVQEDYKMVVRPQNAKDAAKALKLEGKENKELLASARLAESDAMMLQTKGTIAALPPTWTLENFTVVTDRKGVNHVSFKAKDVARTPEREKYARALGIEIDKEGKWAILIDELVAKQKAKLDKPIDV